MSDISDSIPTITFVNGRTLRTYKGVVIDITPDPVREEVQRVLARIAIGELGAYEVLNHPEGIDQQEAAIIIQRLYDSHCECSGLHPDDDFEEILDLICDELNESYTIN